jgi:deoxyribonuclease-4
LRIGIHCSTAGSLEKAAIKANELGANTFQIFSASPRMWRAKIPDLQQVRRLHQEREKHDLTPLVVHDSYLINLASNDPVIRENSVRAFTGELERALLIGAEYLVAHPGNYKGLTVDQGIFNVAENLVLAWRAVDEQLRGKPKLTILLENTAGAGAQLGGRLHELATIRELTGGYLDIPIGYCLDTCHCYVSGFDIAHEHGLTKLIKAASLTLGLDLVPVIHANDAKAGLNSHVDRHANIGEGKAQVLRARDAAVSERRAAHGTRAQLLDRRRARPLHVDARLQRAHPMGWDAFGLPAENAAIKNWPRAARVDAQQHRAHEAQMQRLGFRYDWNREVTTCEPEYYRWNQWFFLKMFERGLAYRKKRW